MLLSSGYLRGIFGIKRKLILCIKETTVWVVHSECKGTKNIAYMQIKIKQNRTHYHTITLSHKKLCRMVLISLAPYTNVYTKNIIHLTTIQPFCSLKICTMRRSLCINRSHLSPGEFYTQLMQIASFDRQSM